MTFRSARVATVVGGMLALSMVGAPALAAEPSADDPAATVNTLLDTLVAKDFADIASFVCAQYRDAVATELDFSAQLGDIPGVDTQAVLDALVLSTPDRVVTVLSNDGTSAEVDVVATLMVGLDEEAAKVFIAQLLESQGMEVSDEMIAVLMPELKAQFEGQFGEGKSLSEQVDMVFEDGRWLVCEELGDDASASPSPSAVPAASVGAPGLPAASPAA